jgi:ADP-ribose pyrophosphatase
MKTGLTLEQRDIIHRGAMIDLIVDHLRTASGNGTIREIVRHPGGAVAVPVFENGDVLLIRQYRYPIDATIYEFPAGKLDAGEAPEVCARRELEEETGYRAAKWQKLTSMFTAPGFCDEVLHLYLATELQELAGGQRLEEGEESIAVERIPLARALQMAAGREITDGKTIAGLFLASQALAP